MGRIRIDPDGLRSFMISLDGHISEYEALNGRLQGLNSSINSTWTGQAQVSFASMMQGYIQQTQNLGKVLYQFRGYAQNAADRFENLDAECAQRILSSF